MSRGCALFSRCAIEVGVLGWEYRTRLPVAGKDLSFSDLLSLALSTQASLPGPARPGPFGNTTRLTHRDTRLYTRALYLFAAPPLPWLTKCKQRSFRGSGICLGKSLVSCQIRSVRSDQIRSGQVNGNPLTPSSRLFSCCHMP